jgi:SAM-dependent methyltransferase
MPRSASIPVISTPTPDGALLAVAAPRGTADLARAARLTGTARQLLEQLGSGAGEPEVAGWLAQNGAADPAQARADARRFLEELRAHGLAGLADRPESAGPPPAPAGESAGPPADVDAASWVALARAVLESGNRLRFRALGRSMRPLVPHGSLLEVEPRPFERVRLGEVVLHSLAGAPLVAHRVVGRRAGELLTRGDSNARLDRVRPGDYLGVVTAREQDGEWRRVSSGPARWLGLASGLGYRLLVGLARLLVLRPLRATFGPDGERRSLARACLRAVLRALSAALLLLERAAARLRRPLDVLRAALLSTREKDEDRARLYARSAIQEFTALEENVRSGLTLLEEVLLLRHPLPPGKALVLGCGPGRECLVLARRGFTVTGLDREPGMLERARALAAEAGLPVRYVAGEASALELPGESFDLVVVFSGLYNMLLPRARRVRMLAAARAHLVPGGHVLVTFLSAYRRPGEDPPRGKHLLEAMNPDHERGDFYLLNEAVHLFPRGEDVADEAREAGLETVELFRDQRAYDRSSGQARGYAVLRLPPSGPDRESGQGRAFHRPIQERPKPRAG